MLTLFLSRLLKGNRWRKNQMANQKLTQNPANDISIPQRRSPIELRIHGDEILLSGRFHRWQATAFTAADLDELSVRMAVDSTSPDQLTAVGDPNRQPDRPTDLFSFHSDKVHRHHPSIYRADGQLRTNTGTHPLEMQIEIPEGHNAFFAVSFVANKAVLGDAWAELITGGSSGGGIDAERRLDPWATVINPELAAA